jgi:uncharacterized MAPEG superfamily protein
MFAGSTELQMLCWAIVLGLAQLAIATTLSVLERGLPWAAGPRDTPAPPLARFAGRMDRAWCNYRETFVYFAASVLAVTALGKTSASSALGAEIYLAARIVYVPLYAAGLPFVRTLVWGVSAAGIVMVLLAAA